MKKPLSLYLHIPFCVKKCSYCDFVSFASTPEQQAVYVDLLLKELALQKDLLFSRKISSIFIGGGTPSILSVSSLKKLLSSLQIYMPPENLLEFTVECNCESITQEKLDVFKSYGVNRLSLGLQSTLDSELALLGRPHSYEDFLKAFHLSRQVGFSNISVDLMFNLPGQTPEDFTHSLKKVAALSPTHISCYSLILEENTPLQQQVQKGFLPEPQDDAYITMYRHAIRFLKNQGFFQYEFSNFARPGFESVHNCGYWNRQDYLGLGLAAHSFVQGVRFHNPPSMQSYQEALCQDHLPHEDKEVLTSQDAFEETLFLGLRMTKGILLQDLEKNFPNSLTPSFRSVLYSLENRKLLRVDLGGRLSLTQKGIEISNAVFVEMMEASQPNADSG